MATFYDDFERANGALGGNWVDAYSTATISGGYAIGGTDAYAVNTTVTDTDYQEVVCQVAFLSGQGQTGGPLIKATNSGRAGYWCWFYYSAPNWVFGLYKRGASGNTLLASTTYGASIPYLSTMRIVWDAGTITATVNGGSTLTSDDSQYALNTYMGMRLPSANMAIADFRAFGTLAAQLSADPDVVGNYGTCTDIDLTGTNTSWTEGTPGSPTFTVDRGTISAQTVTDATHATITYCPGNYLGAAIITDPSTGLTVGIVVTSDPAIIPPPDTGERPGVEAGQMLDDTAAHTSGDLATSDMPVIMIDPGTWSLGLREAINDIWHGMFNGYVPSQASSGIVQTLWYLLNGGYPNAIGPFPEPHFLTVDAGLDQIWTIVNTMSQTNTLTLQDVLDAIAEGGGSNQDVLDAIGTSWFDPLYTLHDDLDYLDNRSDHSLDQIQTRLGNMWGSDHWSLSQIVGAASDPQIESFASLHNIYARLQAMRGDSTSTIANAEDWANLANTNAAAAHSAIDAVRTAENLTLQDILDRLSTITDQIDAISVPTAPVWPGVANATVYAPYNLADGLTVAGPLHGLLFTITGQPAGAGRYRFGTHNSWTKCGACIFTSDRGDHERAQQFGLDAHIVCPKEMRSAASATLRLNTGWTGTVRRFVID